MFGHLKRFVAGPGALFESPVDRSSVSSRAILTPLSRDEAPRLRIARIKKHCGRTRNYQTPRTCSWLTVTLATRCGPAPLYAERTTFHANPTPAKKTACSRSGNTPKAKQTEGVQKSQSLRSVSAYSARTCSAASATLQRRT